MGLRKGQGVTLDGYLARPHLNGQTGTVEHRDPASGRLRIRLSETPWQTVKAVDHQCQPAEGSWDGLSASSILMAGRTPRLEGDQAPGTPPGMSSTFHPAAASSSPATPRQEPKHLRLLESRVKRGHIRVKDDLRTTVRMDVSRDVHRLRNAGLTLFREADAERGPRSHADPVVKPRRPPEGRVVLLPSSELQSLFEASEDRRFRHQITQQRLPYSIDPRTPGDSDEEDCELCRRDEEKARRQAEEERHIEEHAFDECEVCIRNRERAEQEAREQEERLRAFVERSDRAKEDTQPRLQQPAQARQQEATAPQGQPQGQPLGRRKSRDDYDDFEADSGSQPGSHHSQSKPPAEQGQQPPGQEDDYEAFEDDATWVPGRRPSLRAGAAEAAPPPAAAAPAPASGSGAAAAAAAAGGGAGAEGGAPAVPRRPSVLEHADSILEDQSERELLKEHLLSALSTGTPSPAPAAAPSAPAAEAAAPGTQAQSGPPADDYGEDAFE